MRALYTLVLLGFLWMPTWAQPLSYNVQKITTAQGLTSNLLSSTCQDKYGYIWFGTVTGVNRYDGYGVRNYEHIQGDTCSLYSGGTRTLLCDSEGGLWLGMLNGLVKYSYERDCFQKFGDSTLSWVHKLLEAQPHQLYIGWNGGLAKLNSQTNQITYFDGLKSGLGVAVPAVYDIAQLGRELYLATATGLMTFNLDTEQFRAIPPVPETEGKRIIRIAVSAKGKLWCAFAGDFATIVQTNTQFSYWKAHTELEDVALKTSNPITDLFIDRQDRLWISTTFSGLALYSEATDKFHRIKTESWMPHGIPSVIIINLFQDKEGKIWGASRKGAFFFDPDNNLFESVIPGNHPGADEYMLNARACVETADGNWWLGTGNGLFFMDSGTGESKYYGNEPGKPKVLQDNSVRALFVDNVGDLWISTAKGINLLRAGKKHIEFLGEEVGLPNVVTKAVLQARDGTMWVANFSSSGHCFRLPGEKKFRPLSEHPVLAQYQGNFGQCLLEDSRGRIWFGLDGNGLMYYDPNSQTGKYWRRTPVNDTTLIGNFVYSLAEDAQGRIWAATLEGISVIDPITFRFTNYNTATGLPTNRYMSIAVDRQNRIWTGTSHGLLLLNDAGKLIRQFHVADGLNEDDFTDRPPYQLKDGRLVFATTRGFLVFHPEKYKAPELNLSVMLSEIQVFNKPFPTKSNVESLQELYLPPGNNFFSIDMLAINYTNPLQTWYAYKMEPYDKNWIITQDRRANYTAVPGGRYVFRYKATNDLNNWNVPEKKLNIHIGQHWYKSLWFWGLVVALLALVGLTAYQRRERLKRDYFSLEQKAQALSKEKALVQYENLTQQLNPHFLFNSLASLGSLIRFDQKTASEFLEALSKMYRYILQSRDRETVTLQEEIDFAEHFIKLQQTRFGEAFDVRFSVETSALERKIVPVTLQNLLENALKHNTFDSSEPLVVDIYTEQQYLVVKNNLQRRMVVETSNKQGLSRLRSLYQYLSDYPMEVLETTESFLVKIPLL
ncbi:MAG TPA: two-component regulator propeller domain-containing protein [Saprospiraceae bacterium]|nr:two-component regulator propeller domain-containing protein [Saprospiraceae bacterium]